MLRDYDAATVATLAADAAVFLEPAQHLVREALDSAATFADTLASLTTAQHYLDAMLHVASAAALDNVPRLAERLSGDGD